MRSIIGTAAGVPAWRDGARAFPLACWGALGIVLALLAAPGRLAPPVDATLRRDVPLDRRATPDLRAVAMEATDLLATDDDRRTGTLPEHGDGAAVAAPPAHVGLALARGGGPHAGSLGGAAAARIPAPPRAPPLVA